MGHVHDFRSGALGEVVDQLVVDQKVVDQEVVDQLVVVDQNVADHHVFFSLVKTVD